MPSNNCSQPRPLSESLPSDFAASPETPEIWADILGLDLPYNDEIYALSGARQADNVCQPPVRVEFLNCLCEDSKHTLHNYHCSTSNLAEFYRGFLPWGAAHIFLD